MDLALGTLRITDGKYKKYEDSRDYGRAFQLIATEAIVAPDVVTCILLIPLSSIYFC